MGRFSFSRVSFGASKSPFSKARTAISAVSFEEPRGTRKINAPMSFGILHLGPAVADFMRRYPDLQVQLTLNDRLIDPIEEGFDVTIRIARTPKYTTLIYEAIDRRDRLLCASPGYLETAGTPTHPRELPNYSCLHYGYLATGNQWKLKGTINN
ncbi:MAG: substrate binding domain-containing protein [Limnospira sp.]